MRRSRPEAITPTKAIMGLTLVEILWAIGFLAVFTTGLLAIATKSFQLSRSQVDMAAAYQYGESEMERYTMLARDQAGWGTMTAVEQPTFPSRANSEGALELDTRFVYTTSVESLDSDLRLVTVTIYRAEQRSAAATTVLPVIDRSAPRNGEILHFSNLLQQEVNGG